MLFFMIKITSERCPQNHACPLVRVCPKQAITQEGFNAPKIDVAKCVECLICVNKCAYRVFSKE